MKRARNNGRGLDLGAYFIFKALLSDSISPLNMKNYELFNHWKGNLDLLVQSS